MGNKFSATFINAQAIFSQQGLLSLNPMSPGFFHPVPGGIKFHI
jgi:hypothetical protein